VGGALLRQLLEDDGFRCVVSAGRRMLPLQHPKLIQALVQFSEPGTFAPLPPPDVAFCCLGTTMKRAGSRDAFRAVDHDAVLAFAQAARRSGARAFLHVSSLGADPRSRNFYLAVKGETEAAVARLGFGSVHAFRPSLLDGRREEARPGERVGLAVARLLAPLLGKYRPTPVEALAAAMVASARAAAPGVHVLESRAIATAEPR